MVHDTHRILFLLHVLQKEDQLLLKEIGVQGEGDPTILQQLIDDVSLLSTQYDTNRSTENKRMARNFGLTCKNQRGFSAAALLKLNIRVGLLIDTLRY